MSRFIDKCTLHMINVISGIALTEWWGSPSFLPVAIFILGSDREGSPRSQGTQAESLASPVPIRDIAVPLSPGPAGRASWGRPASPAGHQDHHLKAMRGGNGLQAVLEGCSPPSRSPPLHAHFYFLITWPADSKSSAKLWSNCFTSTVQVDPIIGSPPGSSDHRILQVRTLEWVAISFPRGSSQPRD